MAQLVGTDPGRQRFLACGCCKTRWQYRRTKRPFCEDPDDHRLSVLAVEGEGGLRIDYCESWRGYLKTYEEKGVKVCCWRIGLPFSLMLSPPTVGSSGWRDLY
jgi:FdhE protein